MSRRRPATRNDHQAFCETEGWELRTSATGRRGTHHVNHELALGDGRILYTRISHPVDRTDYGPSLWAHILRDQLEVSSDDFWNCVLDGVLPPRGAPVPPAAESVPAGVVRALLDQAGCTPDEVAAMTRVEALARLAQHFAQE